jgi:carbamoyl-phosphate synthase large subunit
MRRLLAEHGVAQPAFAAVRTLHEGRAALEAVGLPAVLRPANGDGRRAVFVLDSGDDLERSLHAALAASPTQEEILERPDVEVW